MPNPAELLQGLTLDTGWYVEELLVRSATQTGGAFSSSYKLSKPDGSRAFLKAMDYEQALNAPDPAAQLKLLIDAYVFEREIVELCGTKRLSRVVKAIGSGKINSIELPGFPSRVVQYLIFELAPDGDLRQSLSAKPQFDLVWTLKSLHEIFVAAQQLHTHGIAHQDIKPSNVLGCGVDGVKLADLGRAWHAKIASPHDWMPCAGARAYAAPESLYQGAILTEDERRYGADFYLLGSMVVFMFSGLRTTASLTSCLLPAHTWKNWAGTYDQVIPYLEHGFAQMLQTLRLSIPDDALWNELLPIIRQTCDPDVKRRGDQSHNGAIGSRFRLERFISKFYALYLRAKLGTLKAA
jgi:eukaryotic-like serine/threonine-protein kinase